MRIGVVSDTHNRMPNVERIVALFREAGAERIVHTGDLTEPRVLAELARVGVPAFAVFGNNDRHHRTALLSEAKRCGIHLVDPPHRLEWASRQILVVHDPEEMPQPLPETVDLVLHGHTHRYRHEQVGRSLIFNPGECAGLRAGANAVGVVDLETLETERIRF